MAYFSPYAPAAQEIAEQGFPKFEDDPDYYEQWWDTQMLRCINGYEPKRGYRISGDFYFHLNFAKGEILADNKKDKRILQYPYTDLDHEIDTFLEDCEKNHFGALIMKGRRMHFSTLMASKLLARWMFSPGTTLGVGAYKDLHVQAVRKRINIIRANLPPELRYSAKDNPSALESEFKTSLGTEGEFSTIHYRCFGGSTLNVGAFRSLSLKIQLFEEIGENPELDACLEASKECWMEGSFMYGLPICGGTSNLMKNPSRNLQKFWDEPEKRGFKKLFLPRQRFYYHEKLDFYDKVRGTATPAQQDKALKYLKKEAERLWSFDNKSEYYAFLQENPTCEEEMFMGDSKSIILPLEKINGQIKVLNDFDSLQNRIRKYNLYWKNNRYDPKNPQVEWDTTCDDGEYWIIEMPNSRYKNLDIGGVDTYLRSLVDIKDDDREHSKGAMYIFRRDNPYEIDSLSHAPIAEYIARYPTTTEFYDGCLKLAVAYSHKGAPCKILSEFDETFYAFMEQAGALKFFREKPTALNTDFTSAANSYMIAMSGATKLRATGLLNDYCNHYIKNIGFLRLLQDLKGFGIKNTDASMAFAVALIHNLDAERKTLVDLKVGQEEDDDPFPSFTRQNGILVPTYSVPKTTIHNFLNT